MPSLEHKIPPPIVGLLVASAMWTVADYGPLIPFAAAPKYVTIAFLLIAGLAFDVLGLLAFRSARTTVNPLAPQRASALVTGGVYKITRNPMYVGMSLFLLAWAVYLSALSAFTGPVIFVLYITRFQIQPEEHALLEKFGDDYAAYAARVRRWL